MVTLSSVNACAVPLGYVPRAPKNKITLLAQCLRLSTSHSFYAVFLGTHFRLDRHHSPESEKMHH